MITLEKEDFEFMLGMDCLFLFDFIYYFYAKMMTLAMPSRLRVEWIDSSDFYHSKVIYSI